MATYVYNDAAEAASQWKKLLEANNEKARVGRKDGALTLKAGPDAVSFTGPKDAIIAALTVVKDDPIFSGNWDYVKNEIRYICNQLTKGGVAQGTPAPAPLTAAQKLAALKEELIKAEADVKAAKDHVQAVKAALPQAEADAKAEAEAGRKATEERIAALRAKAAEQAAEAARLEAELLAAVNGTPA